MATYLNFFICSSEEGEEKDPEPGSKIESSEDDDSLTGEFPRGHERKRFRRGDDTPSDEEMIEEMVQFR